MSVKNIKFLYEKIVYNMMPLYARNVIPFEYIKLLLHMAYIGKNDLKTNFKAMQRFENVRRDAEFLGYVLGESERPNRTETCFFFPGFMTWCILVSRWNRSGVDIGSDYFWRRDGQVMTSWSSSCQIRGRKRLGAVTMYLGKWTYFTNLN